MVNAQPHIAEGDSLMSIASRADRFPRANLGYIALIGAAILFGVFLYVFNATNFF